MSGKTTNEPRRSTRRQAPANDDKREAPVQKRSRKNADKGAGNDNKSVKKAVNKTVKTSTGKKKIVDNVCDETPKTADEIEAAKRTLVGLPEDLHRLIVPRLGLIERGNLAATCKGLHEIEDKIDKCFNKVEGEHLTIDSNGIKFSRRYPLTPDDDAFSLRRVTLSLNFPTAEMGSVMRRLVRTTKFVSFTFKLDLNDPSQASILEFISPTAAYRIDIFHLPQTPASINFIDAIPWNSQIGDVEDTYINLYNVHVPPNKIKELYECAKKSSFLSHRFHLHDATSFAKRVMGITNFTFDKFKKNTTQRNTAKMTTSNEDVEVYHTEHNPIRFFMKDGECEVRVKRVYGELLEVEMKKRQQSYYHRIPEYKIIPFVAK